ncbi:ATPase F0 subunit (mitochondrion) (mitochondrion) [Brachionus plicatilis]|uniref:ATPase F0 subunit (Mitochondrion) n=1 Tax=Brachionus plicatilis TaxID=10195 RepID=A0A3M7P2Y3_BRAPC|nr:ATPase F0 subunit (mitochondrion) [Brachionus plicatilis]
MYMFSYFTLLSSALSPFIYVVLYALFVLELCISMLQAYIFVSLISLYINETVYSYMPFSYLLYHEHTSNLNDLSFPNLSDLPFNMRYCSNNGVNK